MYTFDSGFTTSISEFEEKLEEVKKLGKNVRVEKVPSGEENLNKASE